MVPGSPNSLTRVQNTYAVVHPVLLEVELRSRMRPETRVRHAVRSLSGQLQRTGSCAANLLTGTGFALPEIAVTELRAQTVVDLPNLFSVQAAAPLF